MSDTWYGRYERKFQLSYTYPNGHFRCIGDVSLRAKVLLNIGMNIHSTRELNVKIFET